MAFDAAQLLRHTIAPDRFDQLRSAEMPSVAQMPAEVGRAMGMAVVVEQNPASELQDAMEELSMQFEEKSAKKLGERKLGEAKSRMQSDMARVMAVRGSRLQRNLTSEQIMEMLSRLSTCENYSFTPSGKPIMTEFTIEDIKSKFN
jgi:DNA mismatch repair protein MutL